VDSAQAAADEVRCGASAHGLDFWQLRQGSFILASWPLAA
jgi:hypothetical protein